MGRFKVYNFRILPLAVLAMVLIFSFQNCEISKKASGESVSSKQSISAPSGNGEGYLGKIEIIAKDAVEKGEEFDVEIRNGQAPFELSEDSGELEIEQIAERKFKVKVPESFKGEKINLEVSDSLGKTATKQVVIIVGRSVDLNYSRPISIDVDEDHYAILEPNVLNIFNRKGAQILSFQSDSSIEPGMIQEELPQRFKASLGTLRDFTIFGSKIFFVSSNGVSIFDQKIKSFHQFSIEHEDANYLNAIAVSGDRIVVYRKWERPNDAYLFRHPNIAIELTSSGEVLGDLNLETHGIERVRQISASQTPGEFILLDLTEGLFEIPVASRDLEEYSVDGFRGHRYNFAMDLVGDQILLLGSFDDDYQFLLEDYDPHTPEDFLSKEVNFTDAIRSLNTKTGELKFLGRRSYNKRLSYSIMAPTFDSTCLKSLGNSNKVLLCMGNNLHIYDLQTTKMVTLFNSFYNAQDLRIAPSKMLSGPDGRTYVLDELSAKIVLLDQEFNKMKSINPMGSTRGYSTQGMRRFVDFVVSDEHVYVLKKRLTEKPLLLKYDFDLNLVESQRIQLELEDNGFSYANIEDFEIFGKRMIFTQDEMMSLTKGAPKRVRIYNLMTNRFEQEITVSVCDSDYSEIYSSTYCSGFFFLFFNFRIEFTKVNESVVRISRSDFPLLIQEISLENDQAVVSDIELVHLEKDLDNPVSKIYQIINSNVLLHRGSEIALVDSETGDTLNTFRIQNGFQEGQVSRLSGAMLTEEGDLAISDQENSRLTIVKDFVKEQ